ncbi:MAG: hypothetical protein EPO24_13595 [Bacteroidetes bacterium]|nr:MAG: hypothetical protein EPO24_13595 [Bacteroidota bacterium]
MPEKQNPPKLELQLNESAKLKLLKDKCYEGSSSYGTYYLYSVEQEGVEKAFFAPVEVHQQIVQHRLKAGDEFRLSKVAGQNGKKITGQLIFELEQKAVAPQQLPTNGNGQLKKDDLREIMRLCIADAIDITKSFGNVPFQNEDIRAISSCLFIARTRNI